MDFKTIGYILPKINNLVILQHNNNIRHNFVFNQQTDDCNGLIPVNGKCFDVTPYGKVRFVAQVESNKTCTVGLKFPKISDYMKKYMAGQHHTNEENKQGQKDKKKNGEKKEIKKFECNPKSICDCCCIIESKNGQINQDCKKHKEKKLMFDATLALLA